MDSISDAFKRRDIWNVPETEHSRSFFANLRQMAECLRTILEDINDDGLGEYDVDKLIEIEDTTSATVDMYETGFLPRSFYLYSATNGSEGAAPSHVWKKIHERDDDYFAETLGSFFSEETRKNILSEYLDLFDRRDENGNLLVVDEDRELLWDWVHALVKDTIAHEHEARGPLVVTEGGEKVFTHEKYPEDSRRLAKYAEMWGIDLTW